MSVFGPNQREELIVGDAVAAETTAATFIASATDKEIKVLSADGSAPASGENFKVLQKAAAAVGGYEFSDVVEASKVEKVILKEYAAEVQKQVTATVDTATADVLYSLEVRLFNDGGSLSPENFAIVSGYYLSQTGDTVTVIRDGIIASINANLTKRGGNELSVTASGGADIVVAGAPQTVVRGKDIGKQIEFNVQAKSIPTNSTYSQNTGLISLVIDNENDPGAGTGKYAVNLEWFTKGYAYEVYRGTGYPADFGERTPYYTSQSTNYNAIHIKYKSDRISPGLEEQKKVLTILVERADLAANANTNAVLADLRTVLGAGNVPSDLATS